MKIPSRLALFVVLGAAAVASASGEHAAPSAQQSSTRAAVLRRHAQARGEATGDHAGGKDAWAKLLAGNRRFVAGKPTNKPLVESRRALATGQHPSAVVLGCADSRVGPEHVFDQGLGELFVVRTAGNIADPVALGSLEYAVEHLHAGVLVVLGHEKCGAVAAAASGKPMPSPNLQAIVAKIEPALAPLRAKYDGDELVHHGVHANVHQSARDLLASSPILAEAVEHGELTIVKGVYDLATGAVGQALSP